MLKLLVCLSVLLCLAQALTQDEIDERWQEFKKQYKKCYCYEDETTRKNLFTQKLRDIEQHNQRYKQGLVTWQKVINQYADWTADELEVRVNSQENTGNKQRLKYN